MTELHAGAVAFFSDDDLNAEGLVMAEHPDGSGRRLEIQRPLEVDEAERRPGLDQTCLVTESGACHSGGVLRWRLTNDCLQLALTGEAATVLGLDRHHIATLAAGSPSADDLQAGLTRLLGSKLDASAYGGERRKRETTATERTFLDALLTICPDLDVWLHEDDDGTPWLIASRDFSVERVIHDTLRADFDGTAVKGGWSPACLNWDGGVRADNADIDTGPPDGLDLSGQTPAELAKATAEWFLAHEQRWPAERGLRWRKR